MYVCEKGLSIRMSICMFLSLLFCLVSVSKTKSNLHGKTRGNKLETIAKVTSEVIKRKHREDQLTSTKLFTTTKGSMEEAFPSLSTIGIDQG